jgi:hypothetical protein
MVAVQISEKLVSSYKSTWRYNPEDSHLLLTAGRTSSHTFSHDAVPGCYLRSTATNPISLRSNSHACVCLPSGLFPSILPSEIFFSLLVPSMRAPCLADLIFLNLSKITTLPVVQITPSSCYFLFLRSKYSPNNRFLAFSLCFFHQNERPNFTSKQNNYRFSSYTIFL